MQLLKQKFHESDHTRDGSIQSCIRTNDIGLAGDGIHLTCFEMIGNFSFGNHDYPESVNLWDKILRELSIPVTHVTHHPQQMEHQKLWSGLGYRTVMDDNCQWTDGKIGGYCCEVFSQGLEIGNLVNPLEHSVDVGFGLERLCQIVEHRERVDETTLFQKYSSPIVRDHSRTLNLLWENGIGPGGKGRNFVCRRLIRRMMDFVGSDEKFVFDKWIREERELRGKKLERGRRMWRKHRYESKEFWWETFGILPEEIHLLEGI